MIGNMGDKILEYLCITPLAFNQGLTDIYSPEDGFCARSKRVCDADSYKSL